MFQVCVWFNTSKLPLTRPSFKYRVALEISQVSVVNIIEALSKKIVLRCFSSCFPPAYVRAPQMPHLQSPSNPSAGRIRERGWRRIQKPALSRNQQQVYKYGTPPFCGNIGFKIKLVKLQLQSITRLSRIILNTTCLACLACLLVISRMIAC